VLRAAWRRVQSWYRSVEWTPLDYTRWVQNPWKHLSQLSTELVKDTHHPQEMPQIPYPKSADKLRHYALPTVKDQVAHMIFATLFAPFIEFKSPNVSLGGRWYRPLRRVNGQWHSGSFSLSHQEPYQPYRKSYGLFRRLANWSSNEWLGKSTTKHQDSSGYSSPDEYGVDTLPYLGKKFRLKGLPAPHLCYARLDLKAAYPSISRDYVCNALTKLVMETDQEPALVNWQRWALGYKLEHFQKLTPRTADGSWDPLQDPWTQLFHDKGLRMKLLVQWINILKEHKFEADLDFEFLWTSEREKPEGNSFGIPTGLAVSPLLMNAALTTALDYPVLNQIQQKDEAALSVVYLRFVDDIILVAESEKSLEDSLNTITAALKEMPTCGGLTAKINLEKAKPLVVREFLEGKPLQFKLADKITAEDQGEFVTHLVEHMSAMGEFRLGRHFGQSADAHIHRLHELARWNIGDREVRQDTRLAFAANRLATARIPETAVGSAQAYQRSLEEIRHSIVYAIQQAPEKFGLWRSVVRASLHPDSRGGSTFNSGRKWLQKVIKRIRWTAESEPSAESSGSRGPDQDAWSRTWPKQGSTQNPRVVRYQTDFIRAHFWKVISETICALKTAKRQHKNGAWVVEAWHYRVIPACAYGKALKAISNIESLTAELYPENLEDCTGLKGWERAAIRQAVLHALPAKLISEGFTPNVEDSSSFFSNKFELAVLCKKQGWDRLAKLMNNPCWVDRNLAHHEEVDAEALMCQSGKAEELDWLGHPIAHLRKRFSSAQALTWWTNSFEKLKKMLPSTTKLEKFVAIQGYALLREIAFAYNLKGKWPELCDFDTRLFSATVSSAVSSELTGVPFSRLIYTCPEPGHPANWGYAPQYVPAHPFPQRIALFSCS
jgi:hypothetical protein